MKPLNKTANDLFQHLRTRFSPITIGDKNAEVTTDPMEARFFSFVYEENGETRGPVSISIIDNRSLKVYFSHDMVESITNSNDWYGLLKELRFFAKQNLMAFDARDIQKDQLDTRDFEFIKQNDGPYKETDVEITESAMYGSKRKSMQKFENATLVVYHKKTVDEEKRGARSRHIDSIFIESNHERFRFPINYLNGARAMAVHVSEGGTPYDAIGQHIITTVSEMQNLAKFARMTKKHAMEDSEAETIRNRVIETYHGIKKDIMRMQNVNNYRTFAETFTPTEASGEADVRSLQEKFTRKVWNEQMTDLLPSVQRALEAKVDEEEVDENAFNQAAAAAARAGKPEFEFGGKKYKTKMDKETAHKLDEVDVDEVLDTPTSMQSYRDKAKASKEKAASSAVSKIQKGIEKNYRVHPADDLKTIAKRAAGERMANKKELRKEEVELDEASPSVEKTIRDPNFVLVLKKDEDADNMIRKTRFTRADGLLSFIMSDIASRMIGDGADAVANFASDMAINISDEGSSFGTKITPEYKRDKQLAMMLAKRYLDDIKKMATDPEHADAVRKDPRDVYGAKKKRDGGTHESVEAAFEAWAEEIFEATVGTVGTTGTTAPRTNAQVVKALSGGDPAKARDIKRVSDKLARGQRLTPAEMPVAGEIAKKALTTKKPTAAMQALAQDEYTDLNDDEDLVLEKTLRVKADKDYDGDGEIESPRDEYMGSRDKAIKASMKKKHNEDEVSEEDDTDLVRESLALLKKYAGI
jgi:hypothetical protein